MVPEQAEPKEPANAAQSVDTPSDGAEAHLPTPATEKPWWR